MNNDDASLNNISVCLGKLDTRVENILQNQKSYSDSVASLLEEVSKIGNRVTALEIKIDRSSSLEAKVDTLTSELHELQIKQKTLEPVMSRAVVFILHVAGVVLAAVILSKIGIVG